MTAHHLLIKTAVKQPAHRRPFWIVNQSAIFNDFIEQFEKKHDYLAVLTDAQDATEISLHTFFELKVDAIEHFTDPFLPAFYMGLGGIFNKREILLNRPIRSTSQVDNLKIPDFDTELGFITETIRNLRAQSYDVPVISTCAGPFSLTSFLIEGNISKDIPFAKAVLYSQEAAFNRLLDKITGFVKTSILSQIDAGAEAICIHDPLASTLSFEIFDRLYKPILASLVTDTRHDAIPIIYSAENVHGYLDLLINVGFDVIALDFRSSINQILEKTDSKTSFQGNFDPFLLLGTSESIQANSINHLHNLGRTHGFIGTFSGNIPSYIPYANLKLFVRKFQELSSGYATQ
ncbi:MAG: hypothetical protein K8S87_00280 [Planctomycetes bacterium]|nr:hypothetical protein [Planctomycetota bacterium]